MPAITVNIAVFQDGRILLTKRDDFEVWCLPSGGVEDGESAAQAAIRETREETGLIIELRSLVGIYRELAQFRNQSRESRLKVYQQFIEQAFIRSETEVGDDDPRVQ